MKLLFNLKQSHANIKRSSRSLPLSLRSAYFNFVSGSSWFLSQSILKSDIFVLFNKILSESHDLSSTSLNITIPFLHFDCDIANQVNPAEGNIVFS